MMGRKGGWFGDDSEDKNTWPLTFWNAKVYGEGGDDDKCLKQCGK